MIGAEAGVSIAQAIGVVGGGIVTGALALTALANIPGGRWLFRQLIAESMARFIERRVDRKVAAAIGLERDAMRAEIRREVADCVAPIEQTVRDINQAVNNVPGRAPIKDQVHAIQLDVTELKAGQQEQNGKLDTLTGMVESLVRRP